MLKRLSRCEILYIDDIGYVQQNREEMEVLFTLLAERYERGSVMITSNLPFSRWEEIFKDPMTTAAAIDRLVHHSVIIELNLSSYRMEEAKAAKAGGTIRVAYVGGSITAANASGVNDGAGMLLVADVIARSVMAPQELPVGIVTALFGAPFFLWVLRRAKNQGYW